MSFIKDWLKLHLVSQGLLICFILIFVLLFSFTNFTIKFNNSVYQIIPKDINELSPDRASNIGVPLLAVFLWYGFWRRFKKSGAEQFATNSIKKNILVSVSFVFALFVLVFLSIRVPALFLDFREIVQFVPIANYVLIAYFLLSIPLYWFYRTNFFHNL